MRRLNALLGKEIRQHALAVLALMACLAALYLLMLIGTWAQPDTVSLMEAHSAFLIFVLLAAMVLGNRLVVAEYHGRTQLFVEALPVARWEMLAVKLAVGWLLLLAAAGLSLLFTALAALSREPIDARFLAIVAARTGAFVSFIWAFFFALGLVGRFRAPIYIALVLALGFVDQMTAFEAQRFGPFAVLDNLPFERQVLPARAILETLGLGAFFTTLAFALALIHEGSVAEALARRMSLREKAVIGMLFVAVLLALVVFDQRRDKEPYAFAHDQVVRSDTVPLEILYLLPERKPDAETLLGELENELGALSRMLGWESLPEVRIAYGPSLDAGIYDPAELEENDGILVRANFSTKDGRTQHGSTGNGRSEDGWNPRDFSAYVVGLVLDEATRGRARFEPKAWLRDGFAHWWSLRGLAGHEARESPDLEEACRTGSGPLLRALWATRHQPLDEHRLGAWFRYRERHGEQLAEAVAFSGLMVLELRHGRGAVESLARQVFGREPQEDLRELFYEWRHPMATVFENATGLGWPGLIADWNAELQRLRATPACSRALAAISDGSGTLAIEHGKGTVRDVVFGFRFAESPPPGTLVTLLHQRLTPFDGVIERRDLRRVEKLWPAESREASWRLPGFYAQGSRVFLALEIESAVLRCPIRLAAQRRDLR